MLPSAAPWRSVRQQKKKAGGLRAAHGHGAPRAFLLSLGVVMLLGCGPSHYPMLPSSSTPSSSAITPRFGFALAEAFDAPITAAAAERTINEEWQEGEEEEDGEAELHHWKYEYDGVVGGDGFSGGEGGSAFRVKRKLAPDMTTSTEESENPYEIDAPDLDLAWDSANEPSVLIEGCLVSADITSVQAKHGKPLEGNVAENAIDGDASTW